MMEYDFRSVAYLFYPVSRNGKYVLFHQGHGSTLAAYGGRVTIQFFLDHGYAVLGLMMPLTGENTGPVRTHEEMMTLAKLNASSHPIKFFLEPVAIARKYVQEQEHLEEVAMIGISGGGWTTILYAALDPSVRLSIPVAGSLPLSLRTREQDIGDAEQYDASFYEIAGYMDLYVLGSLGKGRRQRQILNQEDSCCFRAADREAYEKVIQDALPHIGEGSFELLVDESHKSHLISPFALQNFILPAIEDSQLGFPSDAP
jgi:hypothetical protein